MTVSGFSSKVQRLSGVALVGALLSPTAPVAAQDALPTVKVRQMADLRWSWYNEARVSVDRDAFVVVIELGADRQARIVHPQRPSDPAYTKSRNPLFVDLPSAGAMFLRAVRVEVPTIVAFASDLAPDLSSFTADGRSWDFDYMIRPGTTQMEAIRALATVLYGGVDMPFSFDATVVAPWLTTASLSTLGSCGYQLGGVVSPDFNEFLWQAFGPIAYELSPYNHQMQWVINRGAYGSFVTPHPQLMQRIVNRGLWDRFGANCGALNAQRPFFVLIDEPRVPNPGDSSGGVPRTPPEDRPAGETPPTINGVGIVPASPAAIAHRTAAVRTATTNARASSTTVTSNLTRQTSSELVQRAQVAEAIRLIGEQQRLVAAGGSVGGNNNVRNWRTRGGGSTGSSSGGIARGSTSTGSAGVSSGGSSSTGSGAASSAGSARGGEARGGTTTGGRSGTGRP